MGQFVARRAVFHAMMQSLTSFVDTLSKIVINDRSGVDALLKDMREFTDMIAQHDDLLRNLLQVSPIFMSRGMANATGTGNAIDFNSPNGLLIDSWMCAISGRAKAVWDDPVLQGLQVRRRGPGSSLMVWPPWCRWPR